MNVPSFQMPTLSRKSVVLAPDRVRILDRRVFPFRTEFVDCATVEDVARAVEEMVTQSSGPVFAASAGMGRAARGAAPGRADGRIVLMDAAAKRLIATRPTNNLIAKAVTAMLGEARKLAGDEAFAERIEAGMYNVWEEKQAGGRQLGENAAATVPWRRCCAWESGSRSFAPRHALTCKAAGSPRTASPRWGYRSRS
ncbi:MAG: hypothetical protein J0H60_11935 [Rhizobiales bacterium]|nr:hypothetical protein [Hyphomicrobiales bacterium]